MEEAHPNGQSRLEALACPGATSPGNTQDPVKGRLAGVLALRGPRCQELTRLPSARWGTVFPEPEAPAGPG